MSSTKRWPVLLTLLCFPARAWGEEVVVRDERPVAAAIELLQERFRVPITYEDPPYLHPGYVRDVGGKLASRGGLAAYPRRFLLGIEEMELRFDTPAGSVADGVEIALVNLLNANNRSDRPPAFFGLKKMGGRYHVYPERIRTALGDYESYRSVLDVRISLEPKDRICLQFWMDFCAAVARATNVYVGDGIGVVTGNIDGCRTKIGGNDVPARQMLLDYLAGRDASPPWDLYSWELLSNAVGRPSFVLSPVMVPLESLGKNSWIWDVRPLAKAAQRFEEEFGTAVTYEDPPNVFEEDLEDVADKAKPGAVAERLAVPEFVHKKRHTLNFFVIAAATPAQQQQWIQRAVDAYNRGDDRPAMFDVRRMGERFHIVPMAVKTTAGNYEPYKSPLDYRITVEPRDRRCAEFLRELYAAVNQASGAAMDGGAPGPPSNCQTSVGGQDVLARKLLLDFVAVQGRRQDSGARVHGSWQLLSNPTKPQVLFLSIDAFRSQPVTQPSAGGTFPPALVPLHDSPGELRLGGPSVP